MLIVDTALQILQGKQVPPAVYTHHVLVLAEEMLSALDLTRLPYEKYLVSQYKVIPFPRPHVSSVLETKGMISAML
jgi:hypothetical protein